MSISDGPQRSEEVMSAASSAASKDDQLKANRTSEIVRAARDVITELGYAEASMDRIAQAAGLAKGTLYLYFKNKDALLARTFEEEHARLMERMQKAVDSARGNTEKLRALVRESLDYSADHQSFFQALYGTPDIAPYGSSESAVEIRRELTIFGTFVADLIAKGMEAGEFRKGEPTQFALYLTQLVYGAVAVRVDRVLGLDAATNADEIVDFFLHGARAS